MNVRLFLRYDGTAYHGWQIQNRDGAESALKTVQGTLKSALRTLLCDESVEPVGSSRTDAGVHAEMYCASFHTSNESIPADRICFALKRLLPDDIVVYRSEQAPENFHARFDTVSKTYKYLFYTGEFRYPGLNNRAWHAPLCREPKLSAMDAAAKAFIGTHEFDAFCAAGGSAKTTVRTVYSAGVVRLPVIAESAESVPPLYALFIEGDGFLYNMVRIIAGTVLYVGCDKLLPEDIPYIIASKDRKKAGITAPACGLYLHNVKYSN